MGFARKRVGKDGKPRYTAAYRDLRGSIRSAGTFASERAANQAWQRAEVELRQGRIGDPARGRQTLRKYVEDRWLPNHVSSRPPARSTPITWAPISFQR